VASGLGGRLFDALRDRRSLAYTVLAQSWQRLGAGALLTYIATSPNREAEAREQMLAELEGFRREGITADEASRAIAYLAGQTAVERQSGSAVAADLLDAWLAGESLEEFEDPGAPYRRVTVDQVQAVAEEYLDPARRAEGVVRGKAGDQ
jgi:zinc protease